MEFIPRLPEERDLAWLRDLLLPMIRQVPNITAEVEFYTDNYVIKRAGTGEVLMQVTRPDCIEATDTLDNWRAFWDRVKEAIGELHDAR